MVDEAWPVTLRPKAFKQNENKLRKPIRGGALWIVLVMSAMPITVAARSKAWTVFVRLNTEIMGSNPTRGIDCLCAFLLCVGSGLATGLSPVEGVLPAVYGIKLKSGQIQKAVEP
jgi:hypothetical protein